MSSLHFEHIISHKSTALRLASDRLSRLRSLERAANLLQLSMLCFLVDVHEVINGIDVVTFQLSNEDSHVFVWQALDEHAPEKIVVTILVVQPGEEYQVPAAV